MQTQQMDKKWIGDILAAASALGYALESTISEILSREIPTQQYVSTLAIGGFLSSLLLAAIFEMKLYASTPYESFLLMIPNANLQQIFWFLAIYITQRASAVNYNISTLCSNFYTFIVSIFIFRTGFDYLQVFPAVGIIMSVALYFIAPVEAVLENAMQYTEVQKEDK
ncbi:Carboxylate/amino_acid/amine transporter family protein [Hexamita inflata]|uniref:Carboxylate/amino_acid/amine transporter family protein n=1 Tax=Hexamita inflata TaxID=28002 RepID=A0ABP1H926_9EUKA